jgi:hypothetical protein
VIERVALPDVLICTAIVRARLHRIEGDPREGLSLLERLAEQAQRRALDRVLAFALRENVLLLLSLRDAAAAEEGSRSCASLPSARAKAPPRRARRSRNSRRSLVRIGSPPSAVPTRRTRR